MLASKGSYVRWVLLFALCSLFLSACDSGGSPKSTPTSDLPTHTVSPTQTAIKSDTAPAKPMDTLPPNAYIYPNPTLPPLKTPPIPSSVPTFDEIRAAVLDLKAQIPRDETQYRQYSSYRDYLDQIAQQVNNYWHSLEGRAIRGWQGWVVRTGASVQDSRRSITLDPELAGPDALLVYMEDPYVAVQPLTPIPGPKSLLMMSRCIAHSPCMCL
jgi:hypothetical protein